MPIVLLLQVLGEQRSLQAGVKWTVERGARKEWTRIMSFPGKKNHLSLALEIAVDELYLLKPTHLLILAICVNVSQIGILGGNDD